MTIDELEPTYEILKPKHGNTIQPVDKEEKKNTSGLMRRFKLEYTQEIVTQGGYVVKEKPPVLGQICETEHMFEEMLVPEQVVTETILKRLYEGLIAELRNPNHVLEEPSERKKKEQEVVTQDVEGPTIIPLRSVK